MFAFASDATPRPVLSALDEARADRVVQDVLDGGLVVVFVVDHPGGEALAEECALAAEASVVLPGVVTLRPLECGRDPVGRCVDDGVVVGAEQAVHVEIEAPAEDGLQQERQERVPVLVVHEEHRLVDAVRR